MPIAAPQGRALLRNCNGRRRRLQSTARPVNGDAHCRNCSSSRAASAGACPLPAGEEMAKFYEASCACVTHNRQKHLLCERLFISVLPRGIELKSAPLQDQAVTGPERCSALQSCISVSARQWELRDALKSGDSHLRDTCSTSVEVTRSTRRLLRQHPEDPREPMYAVRATDRVPAGSCHFLCFTDPSQSVVSFPCVRK